MSGSVARFHFGLGDVLTIMGWEGGAVRAYRDALHADPDCPGVHLRLGEALVRIGQWREASEAFREAALRAPASAEAQGNLVLAFWRAGLQEEAVGALQRLIRLRPGQGELHVLLGTLLLRRGRREEAIRAFRWASGLSPSPDWSRFFLGSAILGGNTWGSAVTAWRGAINLARVDAAPLRRGRSLLNAHPGAAPVEYPQQTSLRRRWFSISVALLLALPASAAAARVDPPEAREQARLCTVLNREPGVEACRKALAFGLTPPRAALVLRVLAQRLELLKRWDEVVATYRTLVDLEPKDAASHFRLATVLFHGQGKAEEAVDELRAALALRADDALAWAELGSAQNALGRFGESVAAFEEAEKAAAAYFELRPAARLVFEASRRGERWP
jgi:tetratricopeptide (TPR) repeat protein